MIIMKQKNTNIKEIISSQPKEKKTTRLRNVFSIELWNSEHYSNAFNVLNGSNWQFRIKYPA